MSVARGDKLSPRSVGLGLAATMSVAALAHDFGWLSGEPLIWIAGLPGTAFLLLTLGAVSAASDQRVAAILALAGAIACGSLALVQAFRTDEDGLSSTYGGLFVVLAAGALFHELPLPRQLRSTAFATSAFTCLVLSVLLLFLSSTAHAAPPIENLATVAASALCVALVSRSSGDASAATVRWLVTPAAVAGTIGALAGFWLVGEHSGLPGPQAQFVAVLTATTIMLGTCCVVGAIRNGGRTIELETLVKKQEHLLAQRRKAMKTRAQTQRQIRRRYQELFNNVPAPVILTEPSGRILTANPAAIALLGVSSEVELKQRNFADFYANPGDRKRLVDDWTASGRDLHQGEIALRLSDGELVLVLYSLRLVRRPDGVVDYIQGALTDITPLRKAEANQRALEANLRMSQKLEAVGRLAAGIAHEINTPMQYIGDNVYYLKSAFQSLRDARASHLDALARDINADECVRLLRELDANAETASTLELIPGAIERSEEGIGTVTRIVAAMKELAHPGQGSKVASDLKSIIGTALTVTRNEYKTTATVETEFAPIPALLVYRNELCQVFINLIVNASHALQESHKPGDPLGVIKVRTRHDAQWAYVDVEDNGCGIPDALKDKVFDPFFTTKDVGKGTGQGLAFARSTIVDKHGGEITLTSQVGVGTTFTIKLPLERSGSDTANIIEEVKS